MPPKAKITREMIVEAAFQVAREEGAEHISARTVSERLGCSTQPVMYHFGTIEALRRAAYEKTDQFHSDYLMTFRSEEPMLDMGLNYVRFGAEETNLFRFLFQSGGFSGKNLAELLEGEELAPFLAVLSQAAEVDLTQAAVIFKTLALFVHGCASMLANNALVYDEGAMAKDLERVFTGAVYAAREEREQC